MGQSKVEIMEAPQNRIFYGKMECFPSRPTYIGEKGRTLGITYVVKARCYLEHPWETHWEPIENLKGTCWEQRKNEKNSPPFPPPQNLKEKKLRHFECMLNIPIGCMKFLFPKLFVTIFGLG
jgi:hypothetical protein